MGKLGFGMERLGLVTLARPRLTAVAVLLLAVVCAVGVWRIEATGILSDFFRGDNKDYRTYQQMSERFPTSEFDVFLIVEGEKLVTPESLEAVRMIHLELQFVPSVNGVLSIFSMRQAPDAEGYPPPMFPAKMPTGEEFEALEEKIRGHPLLQGKLLSTPDGQAPLTVLIVSLNKSDVAGDGLNAAIDEIKALATENLRGTGLSVTMAGVPVMQADLRAAIESDRLIFNTGGVLMGMLIAILFFQRATLIFIATLCPVIASVVTLGVIGHLQIDLDSLINTIPPLVMVIAFSDAMHMIFSIRRRLDKGDTKHGAIRHSVLTVGPACALTSITTAVAMLSLTYADSAVIETFGVCAAFGTLSAFFVVMSVVPALCYLMIGNEARFRETDVNRLGMMQRVDRFCLWLSQWVEFRYLKLAAVASVLLVALLAAHFQLEPRYRLSDQIPQDEEAMAGTARLDQKLTGAQPIHVMVRWPNGKELFDKQVLSAIAGAHRVMERQENVGNVWSLETMDRWLMRSGEDARQYLEPYIDMLPAHLTSRFINPEGNAALVTGRVVNLDASETVPIVRKLDEQLNALRQSYPQMEFEATGLPVVAALQADNMIRQLNDGLLIAIVLVVVMIGLAFRSLSIAAISIAPNLFPLVATGAMVYALGGGLEYSSVIAFTVAFGLAVDDTIHFLNRLAVEESRTSMPEKAVRQTLFVVGPVLVLTTIVLVLGLAVTVFSAVPPTQLFGRLAMTMLVAALVADLLFLPAIILTLRKLRPFGRRVEDDDVVPL
ncbi:MAG: efflux RND transporter permease subunit [Dichotomicrobium sp.]